MAHEVTKTFDSGGKFIVAPSIYNGKEYDVSTLRIAYENNVIQPLGVFDSREEADNYARERSEQTLVKKDGTIISPPPQNKKEFNIKVKEKPTPPLVYNVGNIKSTKKTRPFHGVVMEKIEETRDGPKTFLYFDTAINAARAVTYTQKKLIEEGNNTIDSLVDAYLGTDMEENPSVNREGYKKRLEQDTGLNRFDEINPEDVNTLAKINKGTQLAEGTYKRYNMKNKDILEAVKKAFTELPDSEYSKQ